MLLSASEIEEEVSRGRICIKPFTSALIRSASYTLRVANRWVRWERSENPIRMWSEDAVHRHLGATEEAPSVVLRQGDFVLGATMESIRLPGDLMGIVCTLSHVARFGVSATAGSLLVRPGFGAKVPSPLTLELASINPSPVELAAGIPICHLAFIKMSRCVTSRPSSVYEQHRAPCPPMLYEDMVKVIDALKSEEEQ